MSGEQPFFTIEASLRGPWWLVVQDERHVIGRVRATGRRKALRAVQERYGGEIQGTGSFYDVLLRSELGAPVRILKGLDERRSDVKR